VSAVEATNRQFRLANRPEGLPGRDAWDLTEEAPREPGEGEVLVKVLMLSLDPAMRGWMNDVPSYIPPFQLNEPMTGSAVGVVVAAGDGSLRFREELEAAEIEIGPAGAHAVRGLHICRLAGHVPASPPETVLPNYLREPDAKPQR